MNLHLICLILLPFSHGTVFANAELPRIFMKFSETEISVKKTVNTVTVNFLSFNKQTGP